MKVQVIRDPEFIAAIQARSERAPERDHGDLTCWREYGKEHYFLHGAYWHTLPHIPLPN